MAPLGGVTAMLGEVDRRGGAMTQKIISRIVHLFLYFRARIHYSEDGTQIIVRFDRQGQLVWVADLKSKLFALLDKIESWRR